MEASEAGSATEAKFRTRNAGTFARFDCIFFERAFMYENRSPHIVQRVGVLTTIAWQVASVLVLIVKGPRFCFLREMRLEVSGCCAKSVEVRERPR